MAEKMKILVPDLTGQMTEAVGENMDICEAKEPWSEYMLEDGSKIKVKQVAINIVKLEQKNPDGTPNYIIQGQTIISVIPKI